MIRSRWMQFVGLLVCGFSFLRLHAGSAAIRTLTTRHYRAHTTVTHRTLLPPSPSCTAAAPGLPTPHTPLPRAAPALPALPLHYPTRTYPAAHGCVYTPVTVLPRYHHAAPARDPDFNVTYVTTLLHTPHHIFALLLRWVIPCVPFTFTRSDCSFGGYIVQLFYVTIPRTFRYVILRSSRLDYTLTVDFPRLCAGLRFHRCSVYVSFTLRLRYGRFTCPAVTCRYDCSPLFTFTFPLLHHVYTYHVPFCSVCV